MVTCKNIYIYNSWYTHILPFLLVHFNQFIQACAKIIPVLTFCTLTSEVLPSLHYYILIFIAHVFHQFHLSGNRGFLFTYLCSVVENSALHSINTRQGLLIYPSCQSIEHACIWRAPKFGNFAWVRHQPYLKRCVTYLKTHGF